MGGNRTPSAQFCVEAPQLGTQTDRGCGEPIGGTQAAPGETLFLLLAIRAGREPEGRSGHAVQPLPEARTCTELARGAEMPQALCPGVSARCPRGLHPHHLWGPAPERLLSTPRPGSEPQGFTAEAATPECCPTGLNPPSGHGEGSLTRN